MFKTPVNVMDVMGSIRERLWSDLRSKKKHHIVYWDFDGKFYRGGYGMELLELREKSFTLCYWEQICDTTSKCLRLHLCIYSLPILYGNLFPVGR